MSDRPANEAPYRLIEDVRFGEDVRVQSFTHLYGCTIGRGCRIGPFVEIQAGVRIGDMCKVQSHVFICEGVEIQDGVFVSHGAMFVNDRNPTATRADGAFQQSGDWDMEKTLVRRGAAIGTAAVIVGGVTIGLRALVGAGAVVTADVADGAVVAGVPARVIRFRP